MSIGALSSKNHWGNPYDEHFQRSAVGKQNNDFLWLMDRVKNGTDQLQTKVRDEAAARKASPPAYYFKEAAIPSGESLAGDNEIVFAGALESENTYFKHADEFGIINYKGAVFFCDTQTDTLMMGDCRNPSDCIRVKLTEGGYLMVNRDNLDQLLDALSFFSPEDQALILRLIQQERMVESSLTELEKEEDKVLALVRDKDTR